MAKPWIHAESSAHKFGGKAEDYAAIHDLLDSSKSHFPDIRHRAITHNSFFIERVIPMIFGNTITNSDGKKVSTQEIAEWHVLEDFRKRFIPTVQDWLENMEFKDWMNNGAGEAPASHKKLDRTSKDRIDKNQKHLSQID